MNNVTRISILLVTNGKPELLSEALRSLKSAAKASRAQCDYLVVINGQDPSTKKALARAHSDVVAIEIDETNTSAARNKGIEHCTGDWIYFAEDDISVEAGFFENFLRLLKERPGFQIYGGPTLTKKDSSTFQKANGFALGSTLASFRCASRYRLDKAAEDCDDSKLTLCNLFVSRALAKAVPLPENDGCAEEYFALTRWRETGARAFYSPRIFVAHMRRKDWSSFLEQTMQFGRERGRLISAGEFRWYHLVPSLSLVILCVSMLAAVVGLMSKDFPSSMISLYVIAVLVESVRIAEKNRLKEIFMVMASIVMIHLGYAIGVLHGALRDHTVAAAGATETQGRVA